MRRYLIPALPFCVMLSACASPAGSGAGTPSPAPVEVAEPADGGASCNNEVLAGYVGKPPTQAVLDEAKARSGARTVRVAQPGMALTMDFRQDRLTVFVGEDGKIDSINCG